MKINGYNHYDNKNDIINVYQIFIRFQNPFKGLFLH